MLKPDVSTIGNLFSCSAAFGRLCVETAHIRQGFIVVSAAAFGRLCVETEMGVVFNQGAEQPPSGGCVLKL